MEYRQDNLTRLDSARELAEQLLSRIPAGSQLSVTHNATSDPAVFLSDSTAAREYNAGRRYSGTRVTRSTSRKVNSDTFGSAISEAVIKELKGTTGRRIVRGILGGLFKGR